MLERFGEAPNREQVNEFKQIARRFFSTHPKEILGAVQSCCFPLLL